MQMESLEPEDPQGPFSPVFPFAWRGLGPRRVERADRSESLWGSDL